MSKNSKNQKEDIISNNGEILFIYDAEMTNPNGDPDNENKPRMDILTQTNLVTDLRLKRYIRDYLDEYTDYSIYVNNPEGLVLNAADRLKFWKWRAQNPDVEVDEKTLTKIRKVKINTLTKADVLEEFIDTRMFGATIPIKSDTGGSSITITGPIQFNWGKSFNKVEPVDSNAITSHFSSREGSQGTMGTDYRLYYSLLGFHGIVSANRATESMLGREDLEALDEAIVKSIPLLATRSKIGQYPRLYIRIEYKDNNFFIGDLRKHISLENIESLRDIKDVTLDFSELFAVLEENKAEIQRIIYWKDDTVSFEPKPGNLFEELSI